MKTNQKGISLSTTGKTGFPHFQKKFFFKKLLRKKR